MDSAKELQEEVMNIICLYWVGEFRGRDFTLDDVDRLYASVSKHMDRPFEFYVLTNTEEEVGYKTIELDNDWPGWWAKMELHRHDLPEGRTLYLDLDSHVVKSLTPILDYPGDLVMFPTAVAQQQQRKLSRKSRKGKKLVFRYQAATMLFDPGTHVDLYCEFCTHDRWYMTKYRSDQDVMGAKIPDQPTFPNKWMIKLRDCAKTKATPKGDFIIVTGQPGDGGFRDNNYVPWLEKEARGG